MNTHLQNKEADVAITNKPILVATDLGARCDRVVDRAVLLANAWQAELVAVHALPKVVELRSERRPRSTDPRKRLAEDVAGATGKVTVIVTEGEPAEVVARVAGEHGCGLILTGVAREESFGQIFLGDTVDRLARRSPLPLLVVKNRPRRPYRHMVFATDFSDVSRHALDVALRMFPPERMTVFHGFDAPLAGVTNDPAAYARAYRDSVVTQECEAFLARLDLPDHLRRDLEVVLEPGFPGARLRDHVEDRPADLVVVGSHGQSALRDIMLGSTAKEILSVVPCDTLLVRRPDAAQHLPSGGSAA